MGYHDIWDEVGHYRSILRAEEEKLKNAHHAMHEHTHKKKPCEKCAEAEESGYGKAWHCDYYHKITERIHAREGDVSRARRDLREAEKKKAEREKANDEDNRTGT